MYIKTNKPFPVGSKVVISFPLKAGSPLHLKGVVAYTRVNVGKKPPGMGIDFKEVKDDERKLLSDFVKKATGQDILADKKRPL